MQLAFTRQTSDILTTAGRSLKDLMIEGAKAAKAIFESVDFSGSAGGGGGGGAKGSVATGASAQLSKLIGGSESYGGNYGAFNRGGSNNGHTAHGSGIDPNLSRGRQVSDHWLHAAEPAGWPVRADGCEVNRQVHP